MKTLTFNDEDIKTIENIENLESLKEINTYDKKISKIEDGEIFNKILNKFNFGKVYSSDATEVRSRQRKDLKRILKMIFNMMNKVYIKPDTADKYKKFIS